MHMKMLKNLMTATLAVAVFAFTTSAAPEIDSEAPDFLATDMNGETIRLSDLRGEYVVLEWTNHECPYVQKHYGTGNMQKTQAKLTDDGAVWLSVISSAPDMQGHVSGQEAQAIATRRSSYADTILMDPSGDIGRLYDARTTPQIVIIDKEGIVRYWGGMDDKPSWKPETVKTATNYITKAWDELQSGKEVETPLTRPYGCSVKYAW